METNGLLKVTALLYFQDALAKQEFESCKELVGIARNFGATQEEVREAIADYLEGRIKQRPNEANRLQNSLRLLKEEK